MMEMITEYFQCNSDLVIDILKDFSIVLLTIAIPMAISIFSQHDMSKLDRNILMDEIFPVQRVLLYVFLVFLGLVLITIDFLPLQITGTVLAMVFLYCVVGEMTKLFLWLRNAKKRWEMRIKYLQKDESDDMHENFSYIWSSPEVNTHQYENIRDVFFKKLIKLLKSNQTTFDELLEEWYKKRHPKNAKDFKRLLSLLEEKDLPEAKRGALLAMSKDAWKKHFENSQGLYKWLKVLDKFLNKNNEEVAKEFFFPLFVNPPANFRYSGWPDGLKIDLNKLEDTESLSSKTFKTFLHAAWSAFIHENTLAWKFGSLCGIFKNTNCYFLGMGIKFFYFNKKNRSIKEKIDTYLDQKELFQLPKKENTFEQETLRFIYEQFGKDVTKEDYDEGLKHLKDMQPKNHKQNELKEFLEKMRDLKSVNPGI